VLNSILEVSLDFEESPDESGMLGAKFIEPFLLFPGEGPCQKTNYPSKEASGIKGSFSGACKTLC
jgi:hypothetical protein